MVNMSQNTENLTNKLKKVRHADNPADDKGGSGNQIHPSDADARSKSSGKLSAAKSKLASKGGRSASKKADSEDPS